MVARSNREEHSFVLSSLECHPHDGGSARKTPGEGRTSLKGKWKTRTPPGGTPRERWNHERGTVNRKSLKKKSNGKKSNWEKWNKNYIELEELKRKGRRPRTGRCRVCQEWEENWRTRTAGRKCRVDRWIGGTKVGVKQNLIWKSGKIVYWGGMQYGMRG